MVDFFARINPANRVHEIRALERDGNKLVIVLSDGEGSDKRIYFGEVKNFRKTLFGAPGDTDELPQNLVGLDFYGDTPDGLYEWELNGDECTWNFIAPLPEVKESLGANL
jgi:hypothetical protein